MSLETKWCAILSQSETNPIKKEILQLIISPQLAINKPCNISKKYAFLCVIVSFQNSLSLQFASYSLQPA